MALIAPSAILDAFDADHVAAAVLNERGVVFEAGDRTYRFALASVSKLFSAYATLIACEERTVALEDGVGPPGSTVGHLLAHASGLSPNDRTQVLAPPGTRRIYSNAGIEVLADFVAARAEMAFGEYVGEAIFAALGMASAELVGSAATGGVASLADFETFATELLAPTLLAPSTLAGAVQVIFPGLVGVLPGFGRQDPCDWGLGFEVRDGKTPHWTGVNNSAATFGHFGQSGTFVWVDPEVRLALVVLTDRPFGEWARLLWPQLADAVLRDFGAGK